MRNRYVSGGRSAPTGFSPALAVVILLGAVLRLWNIDSPVGGFQGSTEARGILAAKDLLSAGLRLVETPPLPTYTLGAVFRVAGVSVVAGRLVSVAASLGLVLAVFFVGRRLFSAPAGLAAAVVVAAAPVSVVTGRNIQPDTVGLCLLLGAFYFWGKAEAGSPGNRLVAGAFALLSLLSSPGAAVAGLAALFVWDLSTRQRPSFLRERWRIAPAFVALAPAALYYGFQVSFDLVSLRRGLLGAMTAMSLPAGIQDWTALGAEALGAFSPLVAGLLALGAVLGLAKPSRETLFVLLPLAVFAALAVLLRDRSGALLWLLPWSGLLFGRMLAGLPSRFLRGLVLVLLAASGAFASAVDLCVMKLGFSEFESFGRTAARLSGDEHRYLVDEEMSSRFGSVIELYDPKARLLTGSSARRAAEGERYILAFVPPGARIPAGGWLFERERYGLELFGASVADDRPDPFHFRGGHYVFTKAGEPFDFGLKELKRYPALALAPLAGAPSH